MRDITTFPARRIADEVRAGVLDPQEVVAACLARIRERDADLKALYAEVGFDEGKDTIAYCRIGERSSHTWFVLSEILGYSNVKNYDGSWSEYGSLRGVPVALGDERGEA